MRKMPTSTKVEVPVELWALVHDLLTSTGMSKVAKSLSKKVEVEVRNIICVLYSSAL